MLTLEYRNESINFLVSLCFEFKIYLKGHTILLLAKIFLHFVSVVVVGASFVEWFSTHISFCYLGLMFAIWVKSFRKKNRAFSRSNLFLFLLLHIYSFYVDVEPESNSRYYVMSCQYTTHIHIQCIAAARKKMSAFFREAIQQQHKVHANIEASLKSNNKSALLPNILIIYDWDTGS